MNSFPSTVGEILFGTCFERPIYNDPGKLPGWSRLSGVFDVITSYRLRKIFDQYYVVFIPDLTKEDDLLWKPECGYIQKTSYISLWCSNYRLWLGPNRYACTPDVMQVDVSFCTPFNWIYDDRITPVYWDWLQEARRSYGKREWRAYKGNTGLFKSITGK